MSESARDRFRKLLSGGRPKPASPPPAPPAGAPKTPAPAPPAWPKPDGPVPPLTDRVRRPADSAPPARPAPPKTVAEPALSSAAFPDAQLFLQQLRSKMARLAEEFAQGKLSGKQFHEIYAHYQRQRNIIEATLYDGPSSDTWRGAVVPGQTGLLRQRNAAQVLSYAIYDNATSMPLASVGDFTVDTALLVPMLSSFRSATAEMFGAGLRSTEIEGGRWLCFVPGRYTTLFVIFSLEPARLQLTLIEDLHRDFEVANRHLLASGEGEEPAQQFSRLWALDRLVL